MCANDMYWMEYSINISKEAPESILRVGAVLVTKRNELLCTAYSGEKSNATWGTILLNKVRKLNACDTYSIYITINTLLTDCSFELSMLLNEVNIDEIFIGLPDPALTCYIDDDPTVVHKFVYRYPIQLQIEILEMNAHFFRNSKQSIRNSPYYFQNRISDIVIKTLKLEGYVISKKELNADKTKQSLANLICSKYGIEYSDAISITHNAISEAFNSKYARYQYTDDVRSLDLDWRENFLSLYKKISTKSMSSLKILNVGVGGGHEATILFSDCTHVTFVDIAQGVLKKIKERMPLSEIVVSSADDLSSIPDDSYDIYISLRTYNSSFFDIKEAILEARRVLKTNAIIIVSVANGFLCSECQCVIPGLIIPGTEFVDVYRGIAVATQIQAEFVQAKFKNIQIWPTNTEIYLTAFVNGD